MKRRLLKPALLVGVLLGLQGIAVLLYLQVEQEKVADLTIPLACERLPGEKAAPDLELERADGSIRRLSDFHDRWVLVHFWATWCQPCREELPDLLELSRQLAAGGRFELVAVAVNEPWEAMHHFFGGKAPAEVVRSRGSDGHKRFGVSTLPDTFLVAPEGTMVLRCSGAQNWRSEAARELLSRETRR